MSVPEPFRNESRAEFLNNFHRMRKMINKLMMRDFGQKKREYDVNLLKNIYDISDDDVAVLEGLPKKYGMKSFPVEKCPEWRIAEWRKEISRIMTKIGEALEVANNIRIDGDFFAEEYAERRKHFEKAQGLLHALKDKFHEVIDIIDTNLGEYEEISQMMLKEINYVKKIKRYDNKIYQKKKEEYEMKLINSRDFWFTECESIIFDTIK